MMESPLNGRLRNIDLPISKGLMPVYEAVVNSIESIEELNENEKLLLSDYHICVEIIRDNNADLNLTPGRRPEQEIRGFKITDNGIGFTDDNWISFKTLDSLKKVKKGCRGIGRVLWLKAFDNVIVDSSYCQDDKLLRRKFKFNIKEEVSDPNPNLEAVRPISTSVHLEGFRDRYAKSSHKTLEKIATGLLEHCLWYFIRSEGVPSIRVNDDERYIDLFDLFEEHMHSSSSNEKIVVKEQEFDVTHVKIRSVRNKPHCIGYCAAGRLVQEEPLKGKIPGLFGAIADDNGEFSYMAYLTGVYLDDKVTSERVNFNIPEKVDGLMANFEVSYDDIRQALFPRISEYLRNSLDDVIREGREKLDEFVAKKAPKYRPIMRHLSPELLSIDPNMSDKDIDLLLHKETFRVEEKIIEEGHDLLASWDGPKRDDYVSTLKEYLNKVGDFKQSDLANYVAHRRVVIDLLKYAVKQQDDDKFSREDVIHDLIVPRGVTSADKEFRRQNLWLIDERLAFHHFLASDKPLSTFPTTDDKSGKEPDIASLRLFENPLLFGDKKPQQASITVIEIKRPMRKGFRAGDGESADPVLQALNYLRRLRGGASAVDGRPIPNADKIPGFVYVLADFTESLIDCCRLHQLQRTADGMGFFGYNRDEVYNAYIQVMSFDGLVVAATERNRAFFDQLGLPSY